jgi:TPP-dependent pyruvate/acetoin dehydrogenase alpha subunit
MDQTEKTDQNNGGARDKRNRRRRPARGRFQMRVSTRYAPRKAANGGPLSCTTETLLKPEQHLELYRYLRLTRLVEERLVNLYRQTKVVGGVFRSLGQEATAVGSAYALQPEDFITPLIRDLGAVLVKGIRPRDIFAQYMAKADGPSGGKDLNIHFGDMERGFIGPISHLGDMIPVMTGILLGARLKKKKFVGVAYIGDGGMSTGAFHEGLNFAAVQRLPLIVIAEHNRYAYSTPTSLQTAVRDLAEKAAGYGIPAHVVDGNDVVACYEVTKHAADYARRGGGAVLIGRRRTVAKVTPNTTISATWRRAKSSGGKRTTILSIVTSVICWNVIWRPKSSSRRSLRAFSARLTRTAPGPSLHPCPRARTRRTAFLITTSCRRLSGPEYWRRNYDR